MSLQANDLVIGQKYFRVDRKTGMHSIVARFLGLKYEENPGITFAQFDAGPGAVVWDNLAVYDIYPGTIQIGTAKHIGILQEGTDIFLADVDPISHEAFEDGAECVRVGRFVYHSHTLQSWLDTGRIEEPMTRTAITLDQLTRFTYRC